MTSKTQQQFEEAKFRAQREGGEIDDYLPDKAIIGGYRKQTVDDNSKVVAEFLYQDENRNPYCQVLKYEPKAFLQQHWEDGRWIWGKPKGPKIPYCLPQLIEAAPEDPVYTTEGEKDADNVGELRGMVVTCATEGAGKWTADLNKWFKGKKQVFILADNDEPGRQHANLVAHNLAPIVGEVRIVSFSELAAVPPGPDGKPKKDVSDWLELGHTKEELIAKCLAAPIYKSPSAVPGIINARELFGKEFEDIKYIVPGLVVEGLTVFAGTPKIGKSWLWLRVGLAVACGGFVFGDRQCEAGETLYLALEDNQRRLNSRMKKLWDMEKSPIPDRLHLATEWPRQGEGGVERIRTWLEEHPKARLVIVDVLAMFRPITRDKSQGSYDADYQAMKSLQALALEKGVGIVIIHHTRKTTGAGGDYFDDVSGTLALSGGADATMVLKRDSGGVRLMGRGRDIEEFDYAVRFDQLTCQWVILGDADEVRQSNERGQVIAALKKATGPMTNKELAETLGRKPGGLDVLLKRMGDDGLLIKPERGKWALPDWRAPTL